MKRTLLLCGLAVIILSGCHAYKAPAGYVSIEDKGIYDFRAVSAEGCYYAIRSAKNQGKASLDFWVKASTNELTEGKGYRLLADEQETTDAGKPMRMLQLSTTKVGQELLYLVALTVSSAKIGIVEAGGPMEQLQKDLPAVMKAAKAVKW